MLPGRASLSLVLVKLQQNVLNPANQKENTPEGQARQIEILKERMEKQKKIEIISK